MQWFLISLLAGIFHQKILESGVLPLALLEKKINNWIETGK
jgi:uncharacterized protein (DUF885 family)